MLPRRTLNSWLLGCFGAALSGCRRRPGLPSASGNASARPQAPFPEDYPWVPDRGDGSYRNPVLFADYSDPDVIRVGDEFYLVASSFNSTPGLPILRSRDLVNWSFVGHALRNLPDARYDEVQHGAGIWAPAIREHAGKYYLFAPTPDEGIYVLTAPHPRGPWTEPALLLAGKGLIDPCPLWDEDGKAYLVHAYARSRAGIKDRLRVRPMAPDASAVLGDGEIVFWDPDRQPTIEGPKFHKRNGFYYILAPAGGVEKGWQLALRSHGIYGPYEARRVLEQGSTSINGPHQGALVDTPKGDWWFVHFQDAGVYGRVVHLNPVTWRDDWPIMGRSVPNRHAGEPVLQHAKPAVAPSPVAAPETSDDFERPALGPAWQWHANHRDDWYSLSERPGFLRLRPRFVPEADLRRAPNLLLQKVPARAFTLETRVELVPAPGPCRAGLVVMGESHAALVVENAAAGQRVVLLIDGRSVHAADLPAGSVQLSLSFASGGRCRFRYQGPNAEARAIDHEFQAQRGRWIGAKVGLFALSLDATATAGGADFERFRFGPPAPAAKPPR